MVDEKIKRVYEDIHEAKGYMPNLAKGKIIDDWSVRGQNMKDWKHVVWNESDDRPATVVSPGYNLLQHENFFDNFLTAVKDVDYTVDEIELIDERERAYMHVLFEEEWLDNEIKAGIRAGNSFDRGRSAFVEFYALRLVCTNGLMGKKVFGSRSKIHVGDFETSLIIENVEEIIPRSKERLRELVTKAQEDFVDTEYIEPILRWKKFSKGLSEDVHEKYSDIGEISRWELYNGVTYNIEHNKDVRESYRETLHSRANDILVDGSDELVRGAERWLQEQEDSMETIDAEMVDDEMLEALSGS